MRKGEVLIMEEKKIHREMTIEDILTGLRQIEEKDKAIQELANALKEAAYVLDAWQIAEDFNPADEYRELANKYLEE